MAILTKEQMLEQLRSHLAEDTSDEVLKLVEDISDTFDDFDNKTKDTTDWKAKYEENDANWRKKYRDRFFHTPAEEDNDNTFSVEMTEEEENKKLTYDNLFKEDTNNA